MRFRRLVGVFLVGALFFLIASAANAAELGTTAQGVLPATTRQLVSIDYHRLAGNTLATRVEQQVLPPEMQNVTMLLKAGGLDATQSLERLTFATYAGNKTVGLIGVAEGNFQNFNTGRFFRKTAKNPNPPQYNDVPIYTYNGLTFFLPDQGTLVFGERNDVKEAIDVERGAIQPLADNNNMLDLISGTESSDLWSVLDAPGARSMVGAMAVGAAGVDASTLTSHIEGARYTIQMESDVKVNLELMTDDAMSASLASTGLRAAVLYKQYQEHDPVVKNLLGQVEVDSAGDHAFLQVSSPEQTVAQLLGSDLFKSIVR